MSVDDLARLGIVTSCSAPQVCVFASRGGCSGPLQTLPAGALACMRHIEQNKQMREQGR